MDRSEIMEIRKLFAYEEGKGAFGNFAGCFINTNKEIKGNFSEKLQSRKKDTAIKFCEGWKKTLANNCTEVKFSDKEKKDGGIQFLLEKMRGTELKNEAVNDILWELLKDALPDNNYAVTAVWYAYDVPVKTKDKLKIDDAGEETFKFIVASVCPVKTEKGSLGYLPDKKKLDENPQLLVLDKPAFGFMYPAFSGRSADTDAALVFRTDALDISKSLFSGELSELKTPEKKAPAKKKAEKSGVKGDIFPDYSSSTADIPSLDTGSLNNDAHYVEEKTIIPDEKPEKSEEPSKGEIISSSGAKKAVKAIEIKGNTEKVKRRTIDGVDCYVIPVTEAILS